MRTVVIVGGSLAGVSAARGLRQAGFDGTITVLGAEAEKPYKRPPLSKQLLVGTDPPGGLWLKVDESLDLDVRLGQPAIGIALDDRKVLCAADAPISFDGLVIATGADPINPWQDSGVQGVHVLRSLADSVAIEQAMLSCRAVAVVGAGFIGAEVAAAARKKGLPVTLIDALPSPHALVLGPLVGAACADLHRDHGTVLRMDSKVVALETREEVGSTLQSQPPKVRGVRLDSGEVIDADLVVVGIGVRPATAWLGGSAIALSDGVVCDSTCAVLDDDGQVIDGVVAAGDVARWHNPFYGESMRVEHWDNASSQGRAAGRRLMGDLTPYGLLPYFWSDQYDAKIQMVGVGRPADEIEIAEGSVADRKFVATYRRRGRLVGAMAMNMMHRLGHYRSAIGDQ